MHRTGSLGAQQRDREVEERQALAGGQDREIEAAAAAAVKGPDLCDGAMDAVY